MKTSENGLELIKVSEGFVPHAYPDPASGGDPWTIAYGHTAGVRPGDTCTPAQTNNAPAYGPRSCRSPILRRSLPWEEGLRIA